MNLLLLVPVLIVLLFAQGCAPRKAYLELQCLDRPTHVEYIQGPVIMDEENIIYYDKKDRLTKLSRETCGVR